MRKWLIAAVACLVTIAALSRAEAVVSQVRAALVQDVHMQGFRPFELTCTGAASSGPGIHCETDPIPVGSRFVVQHVSGYVGSKAGATVNLLHLAATPSVQKRVLLRTHVEQPGPEDLMVAHVFSAPVTLYIPSGERASAQSASEAWLETSITLIGYLVND